MATKYSFNIDSPFIQSPQPKPGDRTSNNPYGLSFGGGYSDAYTKMNERFNLLVSDNLKSLYSFLDDKSLDKLNPQNLFKKDNPLEDSDTEEKKKFNLGKTLLKGVNTVGKVGLKGGELFGKAISIAEPFLHKDKIPENKYALLSSNLGNTIANWAPTLGPGGWIYKGVHALASGTDGMINGSNTGNTLTDIGNGLLGAVVPGAGWLVSKSPEAYRDAMVESSATYAAAPQFALEHGGGKYLVDRENINKELKKANINTFIISNDILKPTQLAFMNANDSRHSKRLESELNGGLNTVVNFGVLAKHGAVLQFSKRTLSKSKVKKHQIGGKVTETSSFVDKIPDKLSHITLDLYLLQKRLAWIEKAIQKASTRNAPYMFKNKDWKNCIATVFDSYGLYDKNGMPLVIRNADFAADPNRYGFTELLFGDSIDTLPDGTLIQDYNNPKDRSTPGHAIILVGRDENEVPIYSWSSGNNEIEDMHPLARLYSFYWTDKVKPKAYQFIGTPEQISQWIDEYKQMYNLSDDDIKAFKEGGKVNVIPSGALHAHKHNLTEVAEDGEKFEDVTTKGIPVVVEDEKGNLIQQAEVEREEIIFRLEVTKKLEELSKKHTDEAAIEAGKLLVREILYNTEDNTGEML